jgi:hypothetical protein
LKSSLINDERPADGAPTVGNRRPPCPSRGLRNGRQSRRGAACVEFAFVAPFLLLLVFGSFEFSRMIMVQQAVTNAAREGCRHAALLNITSTDEVKTRIRNSLKGTISGYVDDEMVRVTCSPENLSGLEPGSTIVMHIEVDCADVSWMSPMFFVEAKLAHTVTMKRE